MHQAIDRLLQRFERGSLSRRELIASLAAIGVGGSSAKAQSRAVMTPLGINHVSIFVPDRARSVAFYQRIFDMPVMSEQSNGTNLRAGAGNQFLGIYEVPGSEPQINHVCFTVEDFDVEGIMSRLRDAGVEPRLRMRENEVAEIYFVDPDGISIQVQHRDYCGGMGLLGDQCG